MHAEYVGKITANDMEINLLRARCFQCLCCHIKQNKCMPILLTAFTKDDVLPILGKTQPVLSG